MRRLEASPGPSWRRLIRLPAFLIVNVALLLVFGVSTVRESYRGWTVDREIRALEAQASALEGRKLELETLTKELGSNDRIEYEARARLGQKKPGERVIVLEGYSASATWTGGAAEVIEADENAMEAPRSNPERWWRYFFRRT
jgi:cell division protein FtsB